MSFVLTSKIIIGIYEFEHVHIVRINTSRKTLVDTAIIQLPQNYNGQYLAKYIKTGMPVEIQLGYNGNLFTEFTGYVSQIDPRTPIMIRCEDEMYQLKRQKPATKSWPSTTLKDVLEYLVPGANINAPDLALKPYNVTKKRTIAKELQKIKENFGLDIYFRYDQLFAGLAYTDTAVTGDDPIIYALHGSRQNVITPMLTYKSKDDVIIKVKAVSILGDNTKIETEVGDPDGELRTLHFYNVSSESQLKTMADNQLIELKYDGFQGSLQTFGIPRSVHGQVAKIIQDKYGARDGSYFIDGVNISFGVTGFRREPFIGKKAS